MDGKERITLPAWPDIVGDFQAAMGRGRITDGYGNSTSGKTLRCANGKVEELSQVPWSELHSEIRAFLTLQHLAVENGTEIPGRMESPLRWTCEQISSEQPSSGKGAQPRGPTASR